MSAITARTTPTILSILKTNKGKSPANRVRFQLPSNVRKIFLDLKSGVNSKDYEDLVCTIRDSEITDGDLLKLLKEAKSCISLLDYDLRLFVQALVILGWNYRSQDVVLSYQDFINNLVSAHSQHAKVVVDQLVKLFMVTDDTDWSEGVPGAKEASQFANVHLVLKSVVRTIPLVEEILLSTLKSNFPYFRLPVEKQRAYIYNCLKLVEYLPQCRREILLILVEKLLVLDVNSPREVILEPPGEAFPLDQSSSAIADSLDSGMLLLFRYIDCTCRPNGGDILGAELKALFDDFMVVLDKILLAIHGSCHVQFIIFYICSFGSNSVYTLAQKFLARLWKKVLDPAVAPIVRKSAVAYIGSFLARADYLPTGFLKKHLQEMSSWIGRYIEKHHDLDGVYRMEVHSLFYCVCQAVFYVIAFRHKDLVDSIKKLKFLQSLNLSKMVTCSLNPLQACSPAVVENFAAVTRDYQLAYCYSIIEDNERSFLHPSGLDTFFPFDPYVLKRSNSFIQPLYREYKSNEEEDDDSENMEIERRGDEDDDFLADRGPITPIKIPDISLGTSPGFKMSI